MSQASEKLYGIYNRIGVDKNFSCNGEAASPMPSSIVKGFLGKKRSISDEGMRLCGLHSMDNRAY